MPQQRGPPRTPGGPVETNRQSSTGAEALENPQDNNSTIQAELLAISPALPFLELHGQGGYGHRRLPFLSNPLEFALASDNLAPSPWSVELTQGSTVVFRCLAQDQPARECLLQQWVELGNERWSVLDSRAVPPYRLASLSAGLHSRIWPLGEGSSTLGRRGRRSNTIELSEPSISRSHATITIAGDEVHLLNESPQALTAVNGVQLEAEQAQRLEPGDLLQLGELLFRWERFEPLHQVQDERRLEVRLLGRGEVLSEEEPLVLRQDKARLILFWLVSLRGAPLAVEKVLEEFWPDRPELRQRKNLSHALRALRLELGWSEAEFDRWLTREQDALRLDPQALKSCDLWRLKDSLLQNDLPTSELVQLHPAPLLVGCDLAWVRALRAELFVSWLSRLRRQLPSPDYRAKLTQDIGNCLREGDFPEFVYLQAFELAASVEMRAFIPVWLSEYSDALAQDIGETPSPELLARAAQLCEKT